MEIKSLVLSQSVSQSVCTHHELCELLIELGLVWHGSGGGEGLETEAAPGIVRHTVGDLGRVVRPRQTAAPASPSPPHLALHHLPALQAQLGLQAGQLLRDLAEVWPGQLGSVDLGQAQASEHLSQAGAGESVAQTVKLHIGQRVQDLEYQQIRT